MATRVRKAFPHGVKVVSELGMRSLVGLEVRESDVGTFMLGWTYPNKDIVYPLNAVQEREDGWVIVVEGVRHLLTPLDKKTADMLADQMRYY
jgi:hypothetical protein